MKKTKKNWMFGLVSIVLMLAFIVGCSSKDENETVSPAVTAAATVAPGGTEAQASAAPADVYPENNLSTTEKVTIKFGFWENGYGRNWVDNAITKFTEKYPNVNFEVTASPKIMDLISTKMSANNDDDMFDLVSPSFNGTEGFDSMRAGRFEDLSDLWDRTLLDSNGKKFGELVPAGTQERAYKINGKSYEIPMGMSTVGLFYDKKFFQENGWNENPKTYEEFVALLESIKAKNIIPITYPGIYASYLDYSFKVKQFELAEHNGTLDQFKGIYDKFALPSYNSPESKEVWSRIYDLGKKGFFPQGVAALNHTQSQMQLLQHKAALASTGDWVQNEMKDSTPEGFEWGFMAIPFSSTPGDSIWVDTYLGSGGGLIWKNKPELTKAWAKEFLLFMLTNDIQAFNNKESGIFPVRQDFLDNPANLEQMQAAPKAVMAYAKENKVVYGATGFRSVSYGDPAAAKALKIYTEMITETTSGKLDPAKALEAADKQLEIAIKAGAK